MEKRNLKVGKNGKGFDRFVGIFVRSINRRFVKLGGGRFKLRIVRDKQSSAQHYLMTDKKGKTEVLVEFDKYDYGARYNNVFCHAFVYGGCPYTSHTKISERKRIRIEYNGTNWVDAIVRVYNEIVTARTRSRRIMA